MLLPSPNGYSDWRVWAYALIQKLVSALQDRSTQVNFIPDGDQSKASKVKITIGTVEPVNPQYGDIWIDTNM